jgi:hypothetical protein
MRHRLSMVKGLESEKLAVKLLVCVSSRLSLKANSTNTSHLTIRSGAPTVLGSEVRLINTLTKFWGN